MYATATLGSISLLAGLGFGIYTASKNFDIQHQSTEMNEDVRILSEMLTQIGFASIQASVALLLGMTSGGIIDCVTCCWGCRVFKNIIPKHGQTHEQYSILSKNSTFQGI